jgi:hypothetical protein
MLFRGYCSNMFSVICEVGWLSLGVIPGGWEFLRWQSTYFHERGSSGQCRIARFAGKAGTFGLFFHRQWRARAKEDARPGE